jgi:hypothetical protein
MRRCQQVKGTEAVEEIARAVREYGEVALVVQDEMEPDWTYPVTEITFDPQNQQLVIRADR